MFDFLLVIGATLYAAAFLGAMALVVVWESLAARRKLTAPLRTRWAGNFFIYLIVIAVNRVLFPGLIIGVALWAGANNWGAFNQITAPPLLTLIIVLVALDFSRYLAHWLVHAVPLLWRLHSMHHTDQDYDFTTSFRFHPLEAIFQLGVYAVFVAILGPPIAAIFLSEALAAFSAILVHGNIQIPVRADALLRTVFVTPDMHRVHHSVDPREGASNFSSVFPWWDHLFGTYIGQPEKGHEGMEIGLKGYEDIIHLKPGHMLIHPFLTPVSPEQQPAAAPSRAD